MDVDLIAAFHVNKAVLRQLMNLLNLLQHKVGLDMVDLPGQMDHLDTLQYKADHHIGNKADYHIGNKAVLRQLMNHLNLLQHKAGLDMVDLRGQMDHRDTLQYKAAHHFNTLHLRHKVDLHEQQDISL